MSPLSFHMHELSVATEIAVGLYLFLDQERPLFYQQCNAWDIKNLETDWTPLDNSSLSSKFKVIIADVSDSMTSAHSRFCCHLFAVCVDYNVSWCMNQKNCEFCD